VRAPFRKEDGHVLIRRRAFLGGMLLAAAGCGNAPARPAADPGPTADEWSGYDQYLRQLTDNGGFSGTVLVARDGRPLLEAGYGMADREAGEVNTAGTLFCIGSMGKMFTGVAVAQLVEDGRVSFEDPIGEHVPGFPPEIADTVTVHHLLTHTAGTGDIFRADAITEENHTIAALMEHVVAEPLQFTPGSRYSYSNAGIITLGALIEHVSGRPYVEHVRDRVFGPAGMVDTDVRSYRPADVPGMAHPHTLIGPDGQPVKAGPRGSDRSAPPTGADLQDVGDQLKGGSPAGGSISTVADMIGFAQALLTHKLLSPAMTDTVLAGKVAMGGSAPPPGADRTAGDGRQRKGPPPGEPPEYAYCFVDRRMNGVRIVGHNGGTPGYEAELDIYPETGHAVVVLANQDQAREPAMRRSEEILTT
jgi:CubicO group peptidase (beta-lactamase class C family)